MSETQRGAICPFLAIGVLAQGTPSRVGVPELAEDSAWSYCLEAVCQLWLDKGEGKGGACALKEIAVGLQKAFPA